MRQNMISIVVPAYEEAVNLQLLHAKIRDAMQTVPELRFELILVDDGSHDETWDVIQLLRDHDPRVKGVRFSRNFGHQAAVTAGYHYASGDAVIVMDADLQHPPELLPEMIAKWREGFDVVSMVREAAPHEPALKSLTSRGFYRIINLLSDVPIRPGVADFRLLDRKVVRKLNSLKERGRFVRGLIPWVGFQETTIAYQPHERHAGSTKYSVRKMLLLALDAISSFSSTPLKISFVLGLSVNATCLVLMGYALYNKINENKDLSEWASTFLTMVALNGIQLLMLGINGIYLARVFDEVKRRPLYIAEEELGVSRKPRRIRVVAASQRGR
jgi:glycosyltransferase involved in cell wall biosynthesis